MKFKYSLIIVFIVTLSSCTKEKLTTYEDNNMFLVEENTELHSAQQTAIENKLFTLINEHRLGINLKEFLFDNTSYYYAGEHTSYMMGKGHTSHAKFGERAKSISDKTGAKFVAENVAKDYVTVEKALEDWLESPKHRKNIEGEYTHSALSIQTNENGDMYFTQIFFR
ncbi:MAG: CAP domain-containing protein [Maribacter sp.]